MFGMDSFEFNKIAGAVLGSLLFLMGLGIVGDLIFSHPRTVVAGYALPGAEEAAASAAPAAAAAPAEPLPVRMAKADVAKGQAAAKACASCHAFEKGGPNKIGPGLWNVVNAKKGAHDGFKYSPAMGERTAKGETWSFDALDQFIANPKGYMPGTAMAYAGLKDADRRADILAYLRSLADTPAELPK